MSTTSRIDVSDRTRVAADPLCAAVRRALHLSRGVLAAGLVLCGRRPASAATFSAAPPLPRSLPGAGGDGSDGLLVVGIVPGEYSGRFVAVAGDVNGDGIDDVVIGAHAADP